VVYKSNCINMHTLNVSYNEYLVPNSPDQTHQKKQAQEAQHDGNKLIKSKPAFTYPYEYTQNKTKTYKTKGHKTRARRATK